MTEMKMLPCPFCGSAADIRQSNASRMSVTDGKHSLAFLYWPYCTNPACACARLGCITPDLAVQVWNSRAPIPMVLYCPNCGAKHVDAPETESGWHNPPHRSHKCDVCELVWRPSDAATVGVEHVETRGAVDSPMEEVEYKDGVITYSVNTYNELLERMICSLDALEEALNAWDIAENTDNPNDPKGLYEELMNVGAVTKNLIDEYKEFKANNQ